MANKEHELEVTPPPLDFVAPYSVDECIARLTYGLSDGHRADFMEGDDYAINVLIWRRVNIGEMRFAGTLSPYAGGNRTHVFCTIAEQKVNLDSQSLFGFILLMAVLPAVYIALEQNNQTAVNAILISAAVALILFVIVSRFQRRERDDAVKINQIWVNHINAVYDDIRRALY
jgi:hypothetical protein